MIAVTTKLVTESSVRQGAVVPTNYTDSEFMSGRGGSALPAKREVVNM